MILCDKFNNYIIMRYCFVNFKVKNVDCVNEPAFTCQRACV